MPDGSCPNPRGNAENENCPVPSSFEPASPALDSPTTSDLERETVRKLRTKTGWYNGDPRALDALRMFEAKIVERERNLSNAIHAPNS